MTATRVLPPTPWMATSPWSLQAKPIAMLLVALSLFGIGEGMLVLSNLGSTPWTVLAQGIQYHTQWDLGVVTFLISMGVLLLWIPLKLKAGLGTILNMILIAVVLEVFLTVFPTPKNMINRVLLCVGGVTVIGIASSLYLTCHMGAGPRDGLMVGICQKTGLKVGVVRSSIEVVVCVIGWALGGVLGVGTLLFAFGVGAVVQISLKFLNNLYAKRKY